MLSWAADFLCCGNIIVELKAVKALSDIECAHVLHYLRVTGYQRALLINFGTTRLESRRFIFSENRNDS